MEIDPSMEYQKLTLDAWSFKYRGSAVVGTLALLMVMGRWAQQTLSRYFPALQRFPQALFGGIIGLLCILTIDALREDDLVVSLRGGLHEMATNMINFAFAALMLGFTSGRSLGGHTESDLVSWRLMGTVLWHEGFPMLIYSQILLWGNSCVSLTVCGLWRFFLNPNLSPLSGPVINLGLEAGRDVLPAQLHSDAHAMATVHVADVSGLFISLTLGIILLTLLDDNSNYGLGGARLYMSKWLRRMLLGKIHLKTTNHRPDLRTQTEHFQARSQSLPVPATQGETASVGEQSDDPEGMGAHSALVALSVFFAYSIMLSLKLVESHSAFLHKHSLLSNVRLFKLSMLIGIVLLRLVYARIYHDVHTRFRPEWFYRMSGVCLDLLCISSVASMELLAPASVMSSVSGHGASLNGAMEMTILGCVLWNLEALKRLAPFMFPNYHYARGMVLIGDALGHSWVGLVLARAYDPRLATPVPLAFTAKMLLSLPLPASAGKNQIVISVVEAAGILPALVMCMVVLFGWYLVHLRYLRPLWPKPREVSESQRDGQVELSACKIVNSADSLPRMQVLCTSMITDLDSGEEEDENETLLGNRGPAQWDKSSILSAAMLQTLHSRLVPEILRDSHGWKKVYSLIVDGASLHTLMTKANSCDASSTKVLVIEDSYSQVFGALICGPLDETKKGFYGSGTCCLFSFHNSSPQDLVVYRWTQANELFMLSDGKQLAFGGGGGFGIHLDDALDNGTSSPCATFGNERSLASSEYFKTLNVELYSLQLYDSKSQTCRQGEDVAQSENNSSHGLEFDI